MGYRLANDFMDNGPAMTTAEWKAMVVLASDADETTRVTFNQVTSDKIMRRIRLAPNAWANLRGDLVRKGYLEVVEAGRKGHCAKYRIPEYPKIGHPAGEAFASTGHASHSTDQEIGHPAGDETDLIPHPGSEADAECLTQGVTPTYYNNSLHQTLTQSGAATAAPKGSRSDPPRVPAEAATEELISPNGQGEPPWLADEIPTQRKPPVPSEHRQQCDRYIELMAKLDDDTVLAAVAQLFGTYPDVWVWAYNEMRRIRKQPRLPKQFKPDVHGYVEPAGNAQARLIYEKALRCVSRDAAWPECLKDPLTALEGYRAPQTAAAGNSHQTYKDPPQSAYYDPKAKRDHVAWQNPTDPDAYEGSF